MLQMRTFFQKKSLKEYTLINYRRTQAICTYYITILRNYCRRCYCRKHRGRVNQELHTCSYRRHSIQSFKCVQRRWGRQRGRIQRRSTSTLLKCGRGRGRLLWRWLLYQPLEISRQDRRRIFNIDTCIKQLTKIFNFMCYN